MVGNVRKLRSDQYKEEGDIECCTVSTSAGLIALSRRDRAGGWGPVAITDRRVCKRWQTRGWQDFVTARKSRQSLLTAGLEVCNGNDCAVRITADSAEARSLQPGRMGRIGLGSWSMAMASVPSCTAVLGKEAQFLCL